MAQSILILGKIHEIMATPAEPDILALAPTADAIIVRTTKLTAAAIDSAPKLKIVSRHGVGYDNVDMAALDRRRIPLTLVGNVNALSVAEHTLFMMLTLAKRGIAYDRATRNGDWKLRVRVTFFHL